MHMINKKSLNLKLFCRTWFRTSFNVMNLFSLWYNFVPYKSLKNQISFRESFEIELLCCYASLLYVIKLRGGLCWRSRSIAMESTARHQISVSFLITWYLPEYRQARPDIWSCTAHIYSIPGCPIGFLYSILPFNPSILFPNPDEPIFQRLFLFRIDITGLSGKARPTLHTLCLNWSVRRVERLLTENVTKIASQKY
jgi:hypothetical protein